MADADRQRKSMHAHGYYESAWLAELHALDFESLCERAQLASLLSRQVLLAMREQAITAGEHGDAELDTLLQKHIGLLAKDVLELIQKREAARGTVSA